MNTAWLIFEIFINLIYGVIFSEFIIKYFQFKETIKYKKILFFTLAILLFALITASNFYTEYEGFFAVVYGVVTFGFAWLFLEGRTLEKFFIVSFEYGALAIIITFVILVISIIFSADVNSVISMNAEISRFLILFFAILFYFIFTRLLLIFKKKNDEIKITQWLLLISVPFVSFILIIAIMEMKLDSATQFSSTIYMIISIILIAVLNIVIYKLTVIINDNNKMETDYALLKQMNFYETQNADNLQKIYTTARTIRHDMKNHIEHLYTESTSIKSLESEENMRHINNINSYLRGLNEELNQVSAVINTGNAALDNVLNYKIGAAKELGIEIDANITCEITGIADTDIITILGNLLNNAIEACIPLENSTKKIVVRIFKGKFYLNISVQNPIEESVIKTNPDLISTKEEREFHGMGVKSVKNVIKKYKGLMNYHEEDNSILAEIKLIESTTTDKKQS